MERFTTRKDGFKEIRKATLIKTLPILLLAMVCGLAMSEFSGRDQHSDVNVFYFTVPLALLALIIGVNRGLSRQKELFESYVLTIDEHGITREQHNMPLIHIPTTAVRDIIQQKNGHFLIKGAKATDTIIVPAQMHDYEKLEQHLAAIRPVSRQIHEPLLQKYRSLLAVTAIGLMAAVYLSGNKIIVGISGTVLVAVFAYTIYETRSSKNIDRKTKNSVWWMLLVAVFIIRMMYVKLAGQL